MLAEHATGARLVARLPFWPFMSQRTVKVEIFRGPECNWPMDRCDRGSRGMRGWIPLSVSKWIERPGEGHARLTARLYRRAGVREQVLEVGTGQALGRQAWIESGLEVLGITPMGRQPRDPKILLDNPPFVDKLPFWQR